MDNISDTQRVFKQVDNRNCGNVGIPLVSAEELYELHIHSKSHVFTVIGRQVKLAIHLWNCPISMLDCIVGVPKVQIELADISNPPIENSGRVLDQLLNRIYCRFQRCPRRNRNAYRLRLPTQNQLINSRRLTDKGMTANHTSQLLRCWPSV